MYTYEVGSVPHIMPSTCIRVSRVLFTFFSQHSQHNEIKQPWYSPLILLLSPPPSSLYPFLHILPALLCFLFLFYILLHLLYRLIHDKTSLRLLDAHHDFGGCRTFISICFKSSNAKRFTSKPICVLHTHIHTYTYENIITNYINFLNFIIYYLYIKMD